MPPLIGTGTPRQVGAAVVTAIERNRAEVTVARCVSGHWPGSRRTPRDVVATGRGIVAKAADEIAAGQTDKR
ncbi:conserved short-chain dehydrogenase domain protein [Mycobacterium kansasii]|uniref:Conserved short-chain dehydrogenase domain protein n=1 Tax=Mycobacterium kansasii TaxID=1768 RepID=A0A1V3X4F8_MYCKA|nr:conserved short-chain dehydrogenase domain protein [Mycobacterium kansasii]